jgi:formate hydrogenlyase subunit 6/NADH:ubiquinone oxidoreductase subunit I
MIDHGIEILQNAGLPKEAIRYDKFEDVRSPAPVIDNRKCTLCDECLLVKPVEDCIVETSAFHHSRQTGITDIEPVRPGETSGLYYSSLIINSDHCIRCYACVDACPHDAISPTNQAMPQVLKQR